VIKFLAGFASLLVCCHLNAQQNLFNIPSADITPKDKFFYQHQLNFYSASDFESKSQVVYGVGKKWDIGLNFVDLPLKLGNGNVLSYNDNSRRKPLYPLVMFTAQKQFELHNYVYLNVGTQTGINVTDKVANKKLAFLNYALVRYQLKGKGYLLAGPYLANEVYVGGNRPISVGLMAGYEYRLGGKWVLMGDFISGDHKKAQTVIGGGYNVSGKLQLFLGSLFSFPNNSLDSGVVLEINWYGWNFLDAHE
jgi:hypothetical protein